MVREETEKEKAAPSDEGEAALAREILEPRDSTSKEGRKGQSPMLNLIAVILIVIGLILLAGLAYLYMNGSLASSIQSKQPAVGSGASNATGPQPVTGQNNVAKTIGAGNWPVGDGTCAQYGMASF